MTLAEITARRHAAEDRHGRVFAAACSLLQATPGGADLVQSWLCTYREMELLRKMEADQALNGKLVPESTPPGGGPKAVDLGRGPTLPETRTELRSDASAAETALVTPRRAQDEF